MRINPITTLNFEKKLVAHCQLKNNLDKIENCNIYQLELDNSYDETYFERILDEKVWKNSTYMKFMPEEINYVKNETHRKIYVLENEKEDCLGFAEASKGKKYHQLDLIETAPELRNGKKYNHIGETLLTFLIKLAKKDDVDNFHIEPASDATQFYKNCGFKELNDYSPDLYMNKNNYNNLINQNTKHTGKEIKLII